MPLTQCSDGPHAYTQMAYRNLISPLEERRDSSAGEWHAVITHRGEY